jgi:iron-sulfur cluster assembly accessory protein
MNAEPAVTVTPAALRRVAHILAGEPKPAALRITVEGGGCSGFSYKYEIGPDNRTAGDFIVEQDGAVLLIDEMSLAYMGGSKVDFVDDLMGQAFRIANPNAVASCGCGTSFSI